ncbi:thiamine biosynthetic bifunctional enzyme [Coemansia spiralis]|uniref:Thiamine biosynthetic bifunctional enzyme n=2 Tax=Coemansia TaxID=4863 RepID=A0A9W8L1C2_9FUNG|nr:Hydroxyethylthiazole kinase family-domain-containing protein [Coemansia spiralis]KAJ1989884.1 thiamine biosynthetic bifunctional enzyme [Coemansia umbellata]KAJ2623114.1 thiamine biosynthetic bifunctional enzyme [Coemansia sp. RSA 1358]KAJ2681057.1 thiamine biosynthetic bifunctional enzyme [Coemansia spiralis]
MKQNLDLTLYLVTDSQMAPAGKPLAQIVDEAIQGGVTIVQLREKTAETGDFVRTALEVKKVTSKAGIPLLINDRVDVAQAVDADGVHIGQDDLPIEEARRILGDNKIIGVSVQTAEEAEEAIVKGADYLGIGTCYDTATKYVKVGPQGPQGVRSVWEHALKTGQRINRPVHAVTIGGVNSYNAVHVLICTRTLADNVSLDGLAVVSAIMTAESPKTAAKLLRSQISFALESSWVAKQDNSKPLGVSRACQAIATVFDNVKSGKTTPLVQHITNQVVINDCANACLALGGSPIMASDPVEQHDLASAVSSLVINIGTVSDHQIAGMHAAMREARLHNTPIVIDPVGVGTTPFRKQVVKELLRDYGAHVIKGNAGEIAALFGSSEMQMRGVDAVGGGFKDPAKVVRELSRRERCVVVMTGKVDYLSDGVSTFAVHNGHSLQGHITGSGCMVGTALGTFIHQVANGDLLVGALTGVVAINLAAEAAALRSDVKGPGTFRAAFIDEMYNLTVDTLLKNMRVERVK